MSRPESLTDAACFVLNTSDANEKVALTYKFAQIWWDGELETIGSTFPPDSPARPSKPELLNPRDMPRRRLGSEHGRIALVHAIAHIELNAIDLAWDIIARFSDQKLPKEFFDDWVKVAWDEAIHFDLLAKRLSDFDVQYGDYPAHNGLWDAAFKTKDDLMARLALVPMLLEPRGLDTTPKTVEKLIKMGDSQTAGIMDRIGTEEIDHVAAGTRWFEFLAKCKNLDPISTYHEYVRTLFIGSLKPPFNIEARTKAGMRKEYYVPLAKTEGAA